MLTRRSVLLGIFTGAVAMLSTGVSAAGVARALDLQELVRRSSRIVVATALDSYSNWETVGGSRRIVTYTRLRVDETLAGAGSESELMVRTLGGRVGTIGQIVHGEATVVARKRALVFVKELPDGTSRIVARTQGFYPLSVDTAGTLRVRQSPRMSKLVGSAPTSAVRQLVGLSLTEAARKLREAHAR